MRIHDVVVNCFEIDRQVTTSFLSTRRSQRTAQSPGARFEQRRNRNALPAGKKPSSLLCGAGHETPRGSHGTPKAEEETFSKVDGLGKRGVGTPTARGRLGDLPR
jgi:hypothetical protein